jgi:hypothetical protein
MTNAVADRASTAAPYSASLPRSPRPVVHSVFRAAGAEVAQIWRTLKKDLCDPYRPELHYMRGPGPKWREKHANASRSRFFRAGTLFGQFPRFPTENSTVKQTLSLTLQPTTEWSKNLY